MSYILDALRRAEAQRARGSVPTLHAPVLGPLLAEPPARPRRTWLVAAIVALALLAVAALWRGGWLPDRPASLASSATVPTLPAPAPPRTQGPVPGPTAGATRPTAPEPLVAAVPPVPMAPPRPESAPRAAPPRDSAPRAAPTRDAAAVRTAGADTASPRVPPSPPPTRPDRPLPSSAPPAEPTAAPTQPRAALPALARAGAATPPVTRRDLPAELQRELPALALNGTVYSPDPAQRMVLVNGEVWREGDRLGPDLVVDEIRRRDAVLRYKGQRFILGP